jgi:hypothetical protein
MGTVAARGSVAYASGSLPPCDSRTWDAPAVSDIFFWHMLTPVFAVTYASANRRRSNKEPQKAKVKTHGCASALDIGSSLFDILLFAVFFAVTFQGETPRQKIRSLTFAFCLPH